jgi:hypothetical protein
MDDKKDSTLNSSSTVAGQESPKAITPKRLIDLGSVDVETRGPRGGTPDNPTPGHDTSGITPFGEL